jgi:hypothetical protein
VLGELADDSERRRLWQRELEEDLEAEGPSTIESSDFARILDGVTGNFIATILEYKTLSPKVVLQNWVVFATMFTILGSSVFLCFRGHEKDNQDRLRAHTEKRFTILEREVMSAKQREKYFIESSTPDFVKYMDSTYNNIKKQILKRHDLLNYETEFSSIKGRTQRIAFITCSVLSLIFAEAVLYDLGYPDFGPCSSYTNKLDCLAEVR